MDCIHHRLLTKLLKGLLVALSLFCLNQANALGSFPKYTDLTIGVTSIDQGKAQNINVQDIIGDRYTVNKDHDENLLFGVGFFNPYNDLFSYGLNIFYLARTQVTGLIFQEHLFDNLSYQYDVTHLPILVSVKGQMPLSDGNKAATFDAGIGPNIMRTKNFRDFSRDGGETIPNDAFLNKTQVEFAASAKVGVLFKNVLKGLPIELAYRFFYLGKGELKPRTNIIQSALQTDNAYAHSLTLSTTLEG